MTQAHLDSVTEDIPEIARVGERDVDTTQYRIFLLSSSTLGESRGWRLKRRRSSINLKFLLNPASHTSAAPVALPPKEAGGGAGGRGSETYFSCHPTLKIDGGSPIALLRKYILIPADTVSQQLYPTRWNTFPACQPDRGLSADVCIQLYPTPSTNTNVHGVAGPHMARNSSRASFHIW
jgi:hypothetical protein